MMFGIRAYGTFVDEKQIFRRIGNRPRRGRGGLCTSPHSGPPLLRLHAPDDFLNAHPSAFRKISQPNVCLLRTRTLQTADEFPFEGAPKEIGAEFEALAIQSLHMPYRFDSLVPNLILLSQKNRSAQMLKTSSPGCDTWNETRTI